VDASYPEEQKEQGGFAPKLLPSVAVNLRKEAVEYGTEKIFPKVQLGLLEQHPGVLKYEKGEREMGLRGFECPFDLEYRRLSDHSKNLQPNGVYEFQEGDCWGGSFSFFRFPNINRKL
jgi:hypothetical protein